MSSAGPPKAASGSPPPTIFPSTVRSGRTPKRSCAPPRPTRKPVITSSNASGALQLQEARRRRDAAHVPGDRLDDDRGKAFAVALDGRGSPFEIVVVDDDRVGGDTGGNAERRRDAERRETGSRAREEAVGVPVVAAGELDDPVTAGEAAGEP